jgi:cell wall-associated NlpC family hydrolase
LRPIHGVLAFGLATTIAFTGIGAAAGPVAATDPTPAPSVAPSPSADPGPSADPSADPSASPADPSPSPDPSSTAGPADSPTPTPTPTPTADPALATSTAATPKPVNRRLLVRKIALRQRWDRYVAGASGPNAFDCSGLVRYAYRKAGVGKKIGGGHSARGMLYWGRLHGLTSRHHPRIGDVVIYGNGRHAAIYIGRGYVISALNPRQDIRITRLHALGDPFTAFIHTRI